MFGLKPETKRCAAGPEPETEPRVLGPSGRDQALPGGSAAPAPSAALLALEPGSCPRGHPEPGCGAQGHTEGPSPRPGAAAPGSVRYLRGPSPRRYTPRVGPRGPRRLLVREVTPPRRLLVTRPQQPGAGQRRPGSRRGLPHRASARRNRDRARQPRPLAGFTHFSFSRASVYSFLLCAAARGGGRCPPPPRLPRSRFSSTPRKLPGLLHLSGRGSCHSSSGIPAEAAGGSGQGRTEPGHPLAPGGNATELSQLRWGPGDTGQGSPGGAMSPAVFVPLGISHTPTTDTMSFPRDGPATAPFCHRLHGIQETHSPKERLRAQSPFRTHLLEALQCLQPPALTS